MTGLDRNQTPKTRPMPQKRTALVASLDIGTSKIACMIARLKPCPPNDALRGRSHAVELIGYSQIQSRGVKAGAVVDLAECEQAVRHAVALAAEELPIAADFEEPVGPGSQPGEVGVYSNGGRLVVLIDVEELVKNRLDLKRAS